MWSSYRRIPSVLPQLRNPTADDCDSAGLGQDVGNRFGPLGKARHLKHSHRTVPKDRPGRLKQFPELFTVCGPMSTMVQPCGTWSTATILLGASASNRSAATTSTGRPNRTPYPEPVSSNRGHAYLIFLDERATNIVAFRFEEGVGHAATYDQDIYLREQIL